MYFHRIALKRDGFGIAKALRAMQADQYGHHQLIWQLFSHLEEREFLFRRQDEAEWPNYYVVSSKMPQDDQGIWQIESKPYQPRLVPGQRLAFSLRANPVVSRKDAQGRRHRHDVVMDAKYAMDYRNRVPEERPPLSEISREAGSRWLADRAEKHGFSLTASQVSVEGYQQHRSLKRSSKMPIKFSTLDFFGVLQVVQPERFIQTLYQGIGPAKGFGCGLLMVRRTC
jgi:CRISPR system Cascade subunit CasE